MTTMSNLASYAPSAYELLHRIGLERRRSLAGRAAARAGWIGVGMAVGSGLALLFSPRSGPVVRERLADTARRAREYVAPSDEGDAREQASASSTAASPSRPGTRRT